MNVDDITTDPVPPPTLGFDPLSPLPATFRQSCSFSEMASSHPDVSPGIPIKTSKTSHLDKMSLPCTPVNLAG